MATSMPSRKREQAEDRSSLAPKRNACFLLSQVRKICEDVLPGAQVRKHLLWRYSIVWKKVVKSPG